MSKKGMKPSHAYAGRRFGDVILPRDFRSTDADRVREMDARGYSTDVIASLMSVRPEVIRAVLAGM